MPVQDHLEMGHVILVSWTQRPCRYTTIQYNESMKQTKNVVCYIALILGEECATRGKNLLKLFSDQTNL